MDCIPPGSSVQGILQARILECVAIPLSTGFSWARGQTWVSCISGIFFTIWVTTKALKALISLLKSSSHCTHVCLFPTDTFHFIFFLFFLWTNEYLFYSLACNPILHYLSCCLNCSNFGYWERFFLNINLFILIGGNYFTILYWFCHTSTWICHRYTRVPHPEPSSLLPPHTIPLGRPSALAPSIQYRALNLDWQLVSYILYMFQCHSPKSSHPLPLPQSP